MIVRRVLTLIVITFVLSSAFTTALFSTISRYLFSQLKTQELLPKAQIIGEALVSSGDAPGVTLDRYLALGEEILDFSLAVYDERGKLLAGTHSDESAQPIPDEQVREVLSGLVISRSMRMPLPDYQRLDSLVVGVPAGNPARYAVFLYKPQFEIVAALGSLSGSMILSAAVVLLMMLLPVYMLVGRIMQPLRQMNTSARAMAQGDFSVRADATQKGEIGQLGGSLNHLAQQLAKTISQLTFERNRLLRIVNGLHEGLVAVDEHGQPTHVNPAMERLFPNAKDARGGQDDRLAIVPDESVWQDFALAIAEDRACTRNLTRGERILLAAISPLADEEGRVLGAVGLFRDITESERLEQTRREYVANVSHEMRTPLTALRGLMEPLRDGMVTDEAHKQRYYDIMLRETLRLSRLIDDLMELSRLSTGGVAMTLAPLPIGELLTDIAEKYQAIAQEAGLTFSLEGDCGQLPDALGNADRIEQVLVILLDNAMKYTPTGGTVALGARAGEREIAVWISDTGMGISEEEQSLVFERFYKVDRAHSGMGSGLGLSIAREIVRRMGQNIWVTSELGKGSTFTFTLRRA